MKKAGGVASAVYKKTGQLGSFIHKAVQIPKDLTGFVRDVRGGVQDLRELDEMLGLGKRGSSSMPQQASMVPQKHRNMMKL